MNKKKTYSARMAAILLSVFLLLMLPGCTGKPGQSEKNIQPDLSQGTSGVQTGTGQQSGNVTQENKTGETTPAPSIDIRTVKPNEAGSIMIVMFHRFINRYEKGDQLYTTTFDAFKKLLDRLYTSGYRLLSLGDYLNGSIDIPAGRIPIVFTFDDGTSGQFNLINVDGVLKANPESAIGVLEEFNRKHPDFGLKGTFFVNLGVKTFSGEGTLAQRLEYLRGKGFELGNHTYYHVNLAKTASAAEIQQAIGQNQKKMLELLPGYTFTELSLPYGKPSNKLMQYVYKGEYQGVKYENSAIVEVGWDPAPSPFGLKFNPLSLHRVTAPGIKQVRMDLNWWLDRLKRENQYVSDGDASTVAVPKTNAGDVVKTKLNGRRMIVY